MRNQEKRKMTDNNNSGESRMSSFLRSHGEVFFSVIAAGVMFAYSYGMSQQEIRESRTRFEEIIAELKIENKSILDRISSVEKEGTGLSHANKWVLEQHSKEIIEVKADNRKISESLADIRTDLRLISAWVRQQSNGSAVIDGTRSNQ
jgi:hypothetical protein